MTKINVNVTHAVQRISVSMDGARTYPKIVVGHQYVNTMKQKQLEWNEVENHCVNIIINVLSVKNAVVGRYANMMKLNRHAENAKVVQIVIMASNQRIVPNAVTLQFVNI